MGELENDMDELFQEAAGHYPLKTDNADWDKLVAKLNETTPLRIRHKAARNKKKLLLFILLFSIGWLYGPNSNSYHNNGTAAHTAFVGTFINKHIATATADKPHLHHPSNDGEAARTSVGNEKKSIQRSTVHLVNNLHLDPVGALPAANMVYKNYLPKGETTVGNKEKPPVGLGGTTADIRQGMANNGSVGENLQGSTKLLVIDVDQADSNAAQKAKANSGISKMADTTEKASTPSKKAVGRNDPFYISLLAGIDASSVKGQSIKKVGYSAGLLVGYNLNKRFGVEVGLLWNDKKYYTAGSYFDKGRSAMPSSTVLLWMDGQSTMIEVPISLKYNFLQSKKRLFFATAGISSYFMKKEGYGYEMLENSQQKSATVMYENTGNGFLSVVGLSVGYEKKLGKFGSLRIGPYLKMPWKGIGIGNLPITSAGIYIGLTHSLP